MKTRVLIADDHALVRAGFCSLLEKIPSVKVIAEAKDGREAIELVRKHQPDVALIDIAMPKLNGLEAGARIIKEFAGTKVIVLSMYANPEYVVRAMQTGAYGYLIKEDAVSQLRAAISVVTRGKFYFSPRISKDFIKKYLGRVDARYDPLGELTPRQREILQLIAEGKNTKEIASDLGVSAKTIESHRLQLMGRLNIHDIAGLVRCAIRNGLVSSET